MRPTALATSANVAQAMVAGQINFGVLHSGDIPVIERLSGKKVTIVARVEETSPGSHYAVLVSNKKVIAERRDALVRMAASFLGISDRDSNMARQGVTTGA